MRPSKARMDAVDRAILNRIQSDFPITERPFRSIGEDVGRPEEEAATPA